jgi:hypothetical protein
MSKMVTYEVDLSNPPALTPEQQAEIEALLKKPASEIDYSDIPPLDEKFWANAVRNPYLDPARKRAKKTG